MHAKLHILFGIINSITQFFINKHKIKKIMETNILVPLGYIPSKEKIDIAKKLETMLKGRLSLIELRHDTIIYKIVGKYDVKTLINNCKKHGIDTTKIKSLDDIYNYS
jgi:hypothetical protein